MSRVYHVYILANRRGALYVGLTGDLRSRLMQHRSGDGAAFTARYHAYMLVYAESSDDVHAARERERQIKRWSRAKKASLIESINPCWEDLSEGI
ncbi:MAG: GIY-YIG nuclease family protein [Dehalococcoidia bacterium]